MGCCASQRPQPNQGQNPNPNQPAVVVSNANTYPNSPAFAGSGVGPAQSNLGAPHVNQQNPSSISAGPHVPQTKQYSQISHTNTNQRGNNNIGVYALPPGKEHQSKISAQYTSNIHPQNPQGQSHFASYLHNENQPKLVELDHAKEFAAHNKSNFGNSRLHEKVHGQEQVLQTYHQNFEIPIFEVALTAH